MAKTRRKQSIPKNIEHDIRRAVDELPNALMQEKNHEEWNDYSHYDSDHIENRTPPKMHIHSSKHHQPQKQRLLIFGVALIAITIFAVWTLNAKTVIYDLKHNNDDQEKSLIKQARTDFNKLFDDISEEGVKLQSLTQENSKTNLENTRVAQEGLSDIFSVLAAIQTTSTLSSVSSTTSTPTNSTTLKNTTSSTPNGTQ